MTTGLSDEEVQIHLQGTVRQYHCKHGQVVASVITRDQDAIGWLATVSDLAKHYELNGKEHVELDPFVVSRCHRSGAYGVSCRKLALSELLLQAIRCAPKFLKKHFPYHRFDPRVELFFHVLHRQVGLRERVKQGLAILSFEDAEAVCRQLNEFVQAFVAEVGSERFRRKVQRCKRAALKNYLSVRRYVRSLFARHARILVVRVDLYYPSEYQDSTLTGQTVTAEIAAADRAAFLRSLKLSSISNALLGYCWKLEYGLKKGFHYHWLFFFDGSQVRQDIILGRLIGEEWERAIGKKNTYWNCNASKGKYEKLGVGMVSYDEAELLKGLDKAVAYLTKPDYALCLAVEKVGRTLGKGVFRSPVSRRGRPRKTNIKSQV